MLGSVRVGQQHSVVQLRFDSWFDSCDGGDQINPNLEANLITCIRVERKFDGAPASTLFHPASSMPSKQVPPSSMSTLKDKVVTRGSVYRGVRRMYLTCKSRTRSSGRLSETRVEKIKFNSVAVVAWNATRSPA